MSRYTLHTGDCLEVMGTMEPNSVDTIVTDPPYGLEFMGKDWDKLGAYQGPLGGGEEEGPWGRKNRVRYGSSAASMQGWHLRWAEAALRVAKPGAMLLAFGGSRTFHRLTCAIEDAGWEVRDVITWLYGSGFPKSHDISKGIDKAAGETRVVTRNGERKIGLPGVMDTKDSSLRERRDAPMTDFAAQWSGWGTALKPAWEPIIVAMKPLDGTFAQNAAKHGVAGLNIEGGRIHTRDGKPAWDYKNGPKGDQYTAGGNYAIHGRQITPEKAAQYFDGRTERETASPSGRWPANLILDEDAAAALDAMSGERKLGGRHIARRKETNGDDGGWGDGIGDFPDDTGGASRFYYVAKASRAEREAGLEGMERKRNDFQRETSGLARSNGDKEGERRTNSQPSLNFHPTVKPLALMRYLVRLTATPTGGVVLDPFMGSGTTGVAAMMEGRAFIGIEREPEYIEIARRRIEHAAAQPRQEGLL